MALILNYGHMNIAMNDYGHCMISMYEMDQIKNHTPIRRHRFISSLDQRYVITFFLFYHHYTYSIYHSLVRPQPPIRDVKSFWIISYQNQNGVHSVSPIMVIHVYKFIMGLILHLNKYPIFKMVQLWIQLI